MPSPSADDQSPITGGATGQEAQSRTGKFLQGIFKRTEPNNAPERSADQSSWEQSAQELIQVMSEPNDWDDGEESNWDDDDLLDELMPKVPQTNSVEPVATAPAIPPAVVAASPSTETTEIIELSSPINPIINAPPPPPSSFLTPPPAPPTAVETSTPLELEKEHPISVNIPRPKNIKYKTKDPHGYATKPPTAASSSGEKIDKAEPIASGASKAIEFNVKRPTTIKYKAKPVEQPSWISKILAPGRELWQKVGNWGDVIPTQLTENPKKILGILAAVLLSIATSWVVVNFWPSQSPEASQPPAITSAGTLPISPEEALITAVRSQFSTLASQYPAGLISNLELDNERQLAIVTLGNLWASLTGDQQQQVAQSLWQQARVYQMAKVEMRSSNGSLLARSPVVGADMVIVSNW
jgi:hypothetical protein